MNWKERIESLLAGGMTVEGIASEMGLTGNAVREVLAGRTKSPRGDAAIALVALCKRRGVKRQAQQVNVPHS